MKVLYRLAIIGWIICFIPFLAIAMVSMFWYWLFTGKDSMTVVMDWWQDILYNLVDKTK